MSAETGGFGESWTVFIWFQGGVGAADVGDGALEGAKGAVLGGRRESGFDDCVVLTRGGVVDGIVLLFGGGLMVGILRRGIVRI